MCQAKTCIFVLITLMDSRLSGFLVSFRDLYTDFVNYTTTCKILTLPEKSQLTTFRPANVRTDWYLLFGLPFFHVERFEFEGQIHSVGGRVNSKSDVKSHFINEVRHRAQMKPWS